MKTSVTPIRVRAAARSLQLKQAVAGVFAAPDAEVAGLIEGFSEGDWRGVLWWLDISGMALYLFDEILRRGLESLVPDAVLSELSWRLEGNIERTRALVSETRAICEGFDSAGIPYALLKGITLTPDSVPDVALRWQVDLDFLVPARCAHLASEFVRQFGYLLHADTGKTLEFRAGTPELPEIGEFYSAKLERALELHIDDGRTDALACRRVRFFDGFRISSLLPADILVRQALHLLKHLCGEHTRMSWVLEFRRHVESRRDDHSFWDEVRLVAAQEHNGNLAMRVAFWLGESVFGPFDFEIPELWEAETLPERVRLWLSRYASEVLYSDSVATKFYALLLKEAPGQGGDGRSTLSVLLPTRLPSGITKAPQGEGVLHRLKRYGIEFRHFWKRFRFHVVEGARFAVEVSRWRRAVARCGR